MGSEIIEHFPHAYIEWSPSRTGQHLFTLAEMPGSGRKVFVKGAPAVGEQKSAVQAYSTGRYATTAGDAYQSVDRIGAASPSSLRSSLPARSQPRPYSGCRSGCSWRWEVSGEEAGGSRFQVFDRHPR